MTQFQVQVEEEAAAAAAVGPKNCSMMTTTMIMGTKMAMMLMEGRVHANAKVSGSAPLAKVAVEDEMITTTKYLIRPW